MTGFARYLRLLNSFARFSLANELAFRGNFVMKVLVELIWLGIQLLLHAPVPKKRAQTQPKFVSPAHHSYLKAIIGSTREARRAGR